MTQAVVLGGGISGLLSAAAIAPHYDHVVLVERDALPDFPAHRPGTPQDTHAHALLAAGQQAIERLLPGFLAALHQDPQVTWADFGADIPLRGPQGWGTRFPTTLIAIGASRPLIEWTIRTLLLRRAGITVLEEHTASGLAGNAARVHAVRLQTRDGRTPQFLDADLVVNATGRSSRADRWLAELGCTTAGSICIDARFGYASRTFRAPDDNSHDWHGCYIQPHSHPDGRGAALMPIEGNRWLVSLIGVGPHRPTHRPEQFLPFAEQLAAPIIAHAIESAEPLTPITVSTATANRRHVLARNRRRPDNFISIGDALCSLNPVYAQGMSSAALQAEFLGACLATHFDAPRLALRIHHKLTSAIRRPWTMATLADRRWPLAAGTPTTTAHRAILAYLDRVQAAGTRDPRIQLAFLNTLNLLTSPLALAAPPTLLRLIRPTADSHSDRHPSRPRRAAPQ